MKLIRLPAQCDGAPWHWHTAGCDEEIFLLPGDALLSETLDRPAAVRTRRQMRQWLEANPGRCQWDPQKERLLSLQMQGETLSYQAVTHKLWDAWQPWLRRGRPGSPLLPDWMLLPAPQGEKFFALEADDTIVFRHEAGCGGALPLAQRDLVDAMAPRWLTLPGRGAYALSADFLRRQVRAARPAHIPRLSRALRPGLSVLLVLCSALLAEQSAEYLWLSATRTPAQTHQVSSPAAPPDGNAQGVSQAMSWLQQIQQQGPVQLQSLSLTPDGVTFRVTTPLPCDEMQSRLDTLALQATFTSGQAACDITLHGAQP